MEATKRKNPDYSATAVKLDNPCEVRELLDRLRNNRAVLEGLTAKAQDCIPKELKDSIANQNQNVAEIEKSIREAIDNFGSYQDVESGLYALKYKRVSKFYNAERFKANYEKLAPAVIVEMVNVKALEGLIKGGLVTEADLDIHNVIERTETYAYLVK